MILSTIKGELVEYVPSYCRFDEVPDGAFIFVRQYGMDERNTTFIPLIRKFLKSSLQVVSDGDFINPNQYIEKEDIMSISQVLIKAANEKGIDGLKAAITNRTKKMVERAIRVAETSNEFIAVATLQEVYKSFGHVAKAATLTPKEAKAFTLAREAGKVTDAVWSAILSKVEKIGDIVKIDGDKKASITIRKDEAEKFQKAVSAIAGMTVSA